MEKTNQNWQDNNIQKDNSLIDVIYDYIRHWKWFILSVILCLIVGTIVIMTSEKQYKSSISILLNEDKNKMGSGGSAGLSLDELGLLSTTSNIDNEIAILTSPDLMKGIVDSLNLTTSYYIKERFRKKEIYTESPFYITYLNTNKHFSNQVELLIEKRGNEFNIVGKYTLLNNEEIVIKEKSQELPTNILLSDSLGIINISLTGKELYEDKPYYVYISDPIQVARELKNALSVIQTSKSSTALNLSLLVNNTEKGATILKELVKQYNVQNVDVNNQIAHNTALFINERLKEISIELSDVERDVVNYKQKHHIADLASEAQMSIQQSGQNQERLMEIETQLNVIKMVDQFVNNPGNNLKVIPNLGISDPTLSQIINDYNTKLLKSESLLKGTGEENPVRVRAMEEINNMRSSILGAMKNVNQAYSISKQDIQRLSGSTMSRIQSIPQQEKGLLERVRQQQIKESLFLFLMQKREETNISIASISDKARIIASPETKIPPVAPQSKVILLASLILGCLIPIVIIYVLNLFKTKISSRTVLERLTNVSVVGQINKSKSKDRMIVHSEPNSVTAELFRSLRNNLSYIVKNQNHKTILITSTFTGEGKTFISANLAMSYVMAHKKVLLVGGDIRKPKIKTYLGLDAQKGLSDYLASDTDEWRDYIIKYDLSPDLDIIISGIIPPNPNELLMSPKLKIFLSEVKEEYDIVIIDTAPVGMVSDTYIFDEHIDVTLYIVRENVTPKNVIHFVNTQKQEERLSNLYLVLNGSSLDKNSGYKYGYAKGYGYGEK